MKQYFNRDGIRVLGGPLPAVEPKSVMQLRLPAPFKDIEDVGTAEDFVRGCCEAANAAFPGYYFSLTVNVEEKG